MTKDDGTSAIYDDQHIRGDVDSITLSRILDVLYFLAIDKNKDKAKKMIELHERGGLLQPEAAINPKESLAAN